MEYELTDQDRERFESKVIRNTGTACWHWRGAHFKKTGYAVFNVKCTDGKWRPTVAHRVSHLIAYGYLPDADTDHWCRNHGCVNPGHLDDVTRRVNFLRGGHLTAISVMMNRCDQGHEFTEENTYVRPSGKRECRTCMRVRDNKRTGTRQEHYRRMYQQRKARRAESASATPEVV